MTKENLIAQLEGAKELTSVVSIDNVIALIQSIEPVVVVEKEFKLTPEFAEEIANKIERALDYNSSDLVDLSSAEFELNWDNRIELNRVDVNVYEIMEHVTGALDQLVEEAADDIVELEKGEEDDDCGPSEEEIMQSVNDGLGTQTEE
jgi:hypothetical protein